MKNIKLLALLALSIAFISCDYDSFEEESALESLDFQNSFVRFLTGDAGGTEDIIVGEENQSTTVSVQSQSTVESEVTVSYTLGGTAQYGTIYTIDGATASGGMVAIPFEEDEDSNAFGEGDIDINFLVDTLANGPLTIILDLASANSSDGRSIDVGQGTLRKQVTLTLVND